MNADKGLLSVCCREVRDVPGDMAEIGVWQGQSAQWILENSEGLLYLYDTFSGFPPGWSESCDYHKAGGDFGDTSLKLAQKNLQLWADRIVWRPGIFPDTARQDDGPFKLVHVDCDLYRSTRDALEWAETRMASQGIMVCDDYDCSSTMGAKKAIQEWLASRKNWRLEVREFRGIIRQQQAEVML